MRKIKVKNPGIARVLLLLLPFGLLITAVYLMFKSGLLKKIGGAIGSIAGGVQTAVTDGGGAEKASNTDGAAVINKLKEKVTPDAAHIAKAKAIADLISGNGNDHYLFSDKLSVETQKQVFDLFVDERYIQGRAQVITAYGVRPSGRYMVFLGYFFENTTNDLRGHVSTYFTDYKAEMLRYIDGAINAYLTV